MTASWLWELANQAQHRIPDPIDYLEMRRRTFGSELILSLTRVTHARPVPAELFDTRPMRAIESAAADHGCLANDVFSYQKEIEFEGETHNFVLVVQQFLNCDPARAVAVVNDLMTARIRQFQHVVAAELPVLVKEFELDARSRAALDRYVDQLRDSIAGILHWHHRTRRYRESDLLSRYAPTPRAISTGRLFAGGAFGCGLSGLGTAAARVAAVGPHR
jgi:germacradienol/geosmin synthase